MKKQIKIIALVTAGLVVGVVLRRVEKRIKFIEKDTEANFKTLDNYLTEKFKFYDSDGNTY
ncbi:hypothetical protein [Globicatella sanguinis]|uniref:hypothetical protein n=1 Tax=Globicatella sanguinis TaxID=13076 RepID=UPI0008268A5F|nr:hypothetical protein [Globicatella sanguinis]